MYDVFPIKTITIKDKEYPKLLKRISDAPEILYTRGQLIPGETCFGIVGTRSYSSYGKQIALEIAGKIANTNITIVSGLALGIDTFSHRACVERNKRTIAVLGTGLDEKSIYPKSNLKLAEKILETGGCLISELPPGTSASKSTFPKRNRIISGLSLGVLVVEAKIRSGSLITANFAFRQKRKVFAVPGSIYSLNSKGTHKLIKQGAKLVEDANDILEDLDLPKLQKRTDNAKGETDREKLILEILQKEPLHIDRIIEKTRLDSSSVLAAITLMEISGKVRNLGNNVFTSLN